MGDVDEKSKLAVPLVLQIVAWVVGFMVVYGAMSARVSVLEDQYRRTQSDIQEMKQDIKTLLLRTK